MDSIHQLSGEVINQIAAGEVVERPAHLVKELVENSVDAGAREITVDVREGGKCISVLDDGKGMTPNDLERAIDRHTTSKIVGIDDLWKLKTFGFRGEALSSIASVSKFQLISRRADQPIGATLVTEFGHRSPLESLNTAVGTTVHVQSLFENVPARLKFLKSSAAEVGAIKQTVKALALANPAIAFRFRVEGELKFFFPVVIDRAQRAAQVLDLDDLHDASGEDGEMQVHLVFADAAKRVRTSREIWIFVQNRWVTDRGIQAAVMEAFRGTLMHGEYPVAAVWLDLPATDVDVNVHPTKSQVKFVDQSRVFKLVHRTLRRKLEEIERPSTTPNMAAAQSVPENVAAASGEAAFSPRHATSPTQATSMAFTAKELHQTQYSQRPSFADFKAAGASRFVDTAAHAAAMPASVTPASSESLDASSWSSYQVLAQAHLTYIVAQNQSEIAFVDQHAAHERILFETLSAAWKQGEIPQQRHLFPLVLNLSPEQCEALLTQIPQLERLGIGIETLGPTSLGINATPEILKESCLPAVLSEIANEVMERGGSFAFEKKLHDIFATLACHSAIRAGQALSLDEMKDLLVQMDHHRFSSYCPHGRPVSVSWSIPDIEREFGRRG